MAVACLFMARAKKLDLSVTLAIAIYIAFSDLGGYFRFGHHALHLHYSLAILGAELAWWMGA